MFGVNQLPDSGGETPIRPRKWLVWTAIAGVVGGPVFFLFALMVALYGPVSTDNATPVAVASAQGSSQSNPASLEVPAPVRPSLDNTPEKATTSEAFSAKRETNPLKAYLSLRGDPAKLQLSLADHSEINSAKSQPRTYRAVCVRLCDGYYFPVGYGVTPDKFEHSAEKCRSRCGSPAKLYVYPEDGGSPAEMRDLQGNAYLTMKNAFLFHTKYTAQCNCRPQPWTTASKARHSQYALAAANRQIQVSDLANTDLAKSYTLVSAKPLREASHDGATVRDTKPAAVSALPIEYAIASADDLTVGEKIVAGTDKHADRIAALSRRATILAEFEIGQSLSDAARREQQRLTRLAQKKREKEKLNEFLTSADLYAVIAMGGGAQIKNLPKSAIASASELPSETLADASADEVLRRNLLPLY